MQTRGSDYDSKTPNANSTFDVGQPMMIVSRKHYAKFWEGKRGESRLTVFSPLVLAADLLLLLGGEVVLDVERLADLVGRLALDHVRDGLAADIQESLNVEVVGRLQRVSDGSK